MKSYFCKTEKKHQKNTLNKDVTLTCSYLEVHYTRVKKRIDINFSFKK